MHLYYQIIINLAIVRVYLQMLLFWKAVSKTHPRVYPTPLWAYITLRQNHTNKWKKSPIEKKLLIKQIKLINNNKSEDWMRMLEPTIICFFASLCRFVITCIVFQ